MGTLSEKPYRVGAKKDCERGQHNDGNFNSKCICLPYKSVRDLCEATLHNNDDLEEQVCYVLTGPSTGSVSTHSHHPDGEQEGAAPDEGEDEDEDEDEDEEGSSDDE